MALTLGQMEIVMTESGQTASSTAEEQISLLMETGILGITEMENRTEKVSTLGVMEANTRESSKMV